ncbi:hypothetical protein NC653_026211 [Populus alba x Populus x berolinensis]|uniref:Uncharacterized protein n=1 Tax=Populus alba x Populus x berolinensis TaxID=444605 RepID=A0AAD6Q8X3_9ROSI|nr:hypothetical protein NC653_026211 [Populus alba x Populus x berolinensis]
MLIPTWIGFSPENLLLQVPTCTNSSKC